MWIVPALVGFVVLMWLGIGWLSSLVKNYEHTLESAVTLGIVGAASLYSGWRTAGAVAPAWSIGARTGIALAAGLMLFTLSSFMVVTLWMAFLTRRFDEAIAALDSEEEFILRQLESMRWQAYVRSQELPDPQEVEPRAPDPRDEWRKAVEAWEQGGGAARIRSLKVLEWRDETARKTPGELRDDILSLEREIDVEQDEAKKDQVRARLAVYKLALYEKEPPLREHKVKTGPEKEFKADETVLRQRLQEIHRELQLVKFEKTRFMRSRVRLGWRSQR
jgi:hypothetical protein